MKDEKYLELLAEKYPTEQAVCREIINLKAILGLPKGTEHFMSDLHGEYEAFCHILNNCSARKWICFSRKRSRISTGKKSAR